MGVKLGVVVTLILLMSLLVTTYKDHESVLRIQNKGMASLAFVIVGVFALLSQTSGGWYGGVIVCALVVSAIGDMMLGIADYSRVSIRNGYFVGGVLWFGVAHILYSLVFGKLVGWGIGDFILPPLLAVMIWGMSRLKWFHLKGCTGLLVVYALILGLMLKKGIDLGLSGGLGAYSYPLILAAVLFVLSDFLLTFKYFYQKPRIWMTLLNLTCYYVAQVMFAVSILYL